MSTRVSTAVPAVSPARQLADLIGRFDPGVARVVRASRRALHKRLPTAIEQVYDNYNFLAIGFCSTERTSDCIVSLAVSPRGVALSFYYGATLPDPDRVLLGSGNQNRFVRLASAAVLSTPPVEALIAAAVAQAAVPLPATGGGYLMIKSVSANQRPRRKPGGAAPGRPRRRAGKPAKAKPRVQ
jgi:hypothetical protein